MAQCKRCQWRFCVVLTFTLLFGGGYGQQMPDGRTQGTGGQDLSDGSVNKQPVPTTTDVSSNQSRNKAATDDSDSVKYRVPQPQNDQGGKPLCDLYPHDDELHVYIGRLLADGAQLLKYDLSFPEYEVNPLDTNMTRNFKAYKWQRVFSAHGQSLLSLAFNYDVLSLQMLTFGVENVNIGLYDSPPRCFGKLAENEKIETVRSLLLQDFEVNRQDELWLEEDDFICHEIIEDDGDGYAKFAHECCTKTKETKIMECTVEGNETVKGLYYLLTALKVAFLMFGPLLLYKWFYKESIKKAGYVVPLKEQLTRTLLLKKVRVDDDSSLSNVHNRCEMKQFRRFKQIVKKVPSDEIVTITFKKLHILVDHRELISEKSVPVGLVNFLYENVLRCGIIKHEPFASCCAESLIGSWSKKFLWFKLMDGSDCNKSCRKFCSWAHIFKFIGGVLLLGLVPLPYILRTVVFYLCEEDEVVERKDALDRLGLDLRYGYNLFQYVTPTHGAVIGMYVAYVGSFALLFSLKQADTEVYDRIVRGAVQDLRNISYVESFRMLFAHLLLPFEKFGIIFGTIVAALYWPFALPICLFIVVSYCIPTLYLTGRFLIAHRPRCLTERPMPTSKKSKDNTPLLSKGTSSFEACLLLDHISPSPYQSPPHPGTKGTEGKRSLFSCHRQEICSLLLSAVIGLLCIINMYVLLAMYAEVVGFVAEIGVLTMMGAIVNAGSAAKYVMLAFWVIMYTTSCFNHAYSLYNKLNRKIFAYIKDKLGEDIEAVTILPEEEQQHTAFKYFTTCELREYLDKIREYSIPIDYEPSSKVKLSKTTGDITVEDVIADQDGKLYWSIKSLIMFVDNEDVPRIPKQLFFDICEQELPGCPGPVYKSMINATKKLLYMVVFLAFVFIVVIAFGNIYHISNTNQMLLTLVSGFLPFVVRFVLMPKDVDLELNMYSFHGKIHQLIFKYSQPWPVFDLEFDTTRRSQEDRPDGGGSTDVSFDGATATAQGGARRRVPSEQQQMLNPPDIVDPTHVDLLITIRDEEEDENLRSEPGSLGSNRSINSGQRNNPDDVPHAGGGGGGSTGGAATANNPTNAFLVNTSRVPSQSPTVPDQSHRDQPQSQTVTPKTSSPNIASSSPTSQQGAAALPTEPQQTQTPTTKRVDLVVDLAKGGVQVRGAEPERSESSANGIPMWPMSSPYKKISDKDSEAAV